MRDIIVKWLHKAVELEQGEEIYLEAATKPIQKCLVKQYTKEVEVLKEISPEEGSQISVAPVFRDGKFWVVLKKLASIPTVGFKKNTETGEVQRVVLTSDAERIRRIHLMLQDGMTRDEVEKIEGELTGEEIKLFH